MRSGCSTGRPFPRSVSTPFFEEWCSAHPGRFVPLGITYLADPELGAAEIRRNADRGFVAVSLPEQPHRLGYPSLHSGWWDPVLTACEETATVICLHVGSSGMMDQALDGPLVEVAATLFSSLSLSACADWLWSGVALRHPGLPVEDQRRMCHANAAELFRHPLPPDPLPLHGPPPSDWRPAMTTTQASNLSRQRRRSCRWGDRKHAVAVPVALAAGGLGMPR
jgi:predicted TIM-barrel fold metal-dependent hydrolase